MSARAGHARADMNLIVGRLRRELIDQRIRTLTERLGAAWKMAELVHPDRPLSRGYARVTDRQGTTLTHATAAIAARELRLRFADGEVDASVGGAPVTPAAVERKPRRPYVAPQPGLFDGPEE
jgi:exodeoxyribonuclease VII large subunit